MSTSATARIFALALCSLMVSLAVIVTLVATSSAYIRIAAAEGARSRLAVAGESLCAPLNALYIA